MTVTDLHAYRVEQAAATLAALRAAAAGAATEDEAREVATRIRAFVRRLKASFWQPYVWQHPHTHPDGWVSQRSPGKGICDDRCADLPTTVPGIHEAWLQRGGRGTGKTEGAAHYVNTHAEGPACDPRVPGGHRFTIVAPTQADAVTSCVTGVTGLQAVNPGVTVSTTKEGTLARWPNGSTARLVGAHTQKDVERCRAWTNVCLAWVEEAAACNWLGGLADLGEAEGIIDQLLFTLRLGERPHMVITTTPRNRPEVTRLIETSTVQTWGRTQDADRLPAGIRASYESRWRGSTLGKQELDGDQIKDVEGALWVQRRPEPLPADYDDDRPGIDNDRVPEGTVGWVPHGDVAELTAQSPEMQAVLVRLRALLPAPPEAPAVTVDRVAVGVDPAGGATENGISVVGTFAEHGYTLADLSMHGPPGTWGMMAVLAWHHFGAEGIALERTFGGDQTNHSIETAARELGLPVPAFLRAPTVEGKKARAIPVQALAQVHRIHHVGFHLALEGEQTTWVEDETPESPNRLDAWVHAVRHLLVRAKQGRVGKPTGGRQMPRSTSSAWAGSRRRG